MTVLLPPRSAFIGGAWVDDGDPFPCENPATTETLCELPATSLAAIDRAVVVAIAAIAAIAVLAVE